jgi:hypothetical protein
MSPSGGATNGWSAADVERLVAKTGVRRELVEDFCLAVDKHLFMLLGERQRRATLHFHLEAGAFEDLGGSDSGLSPFR